MKRAGLALLAWALTAGGAAAKLEIRNVQASYGPLGPERKSLDVVPQDELWFRFQVGGAQLEEGKVDVSQTLTLTDERGKVLASQTRPIQPALTLGGQSFPAIAHLGIGDRLQPGEYKVSVSVRDNLAEESAKFERTFTCRAPEFAIVGFQYTHDAEGKLGAPGSGVLGQVLHFRFRVVGFDRTQGKIDTAMTVQVLNAQSKDVVFKSQPTAIRRDDPELVKKAANLGFNGNLGLNRPGEFLLRLQINDRIGKQKTGIDVPLKVTPP